MSRAVLEKTIQSMHRAQEALEAKLKDREAIVAMYQEKEAAKLRRGGTCRRTRRRRKARALPWRAERTSRKGAGGRAR